MLLRTLSAAVSAAVIMLCCTSASAHVVLDKREAVAGSYFKAVFRVSHGCTGQPTVRITVDLPDSIYTARPQPKPGWSISIEKKKLPQPVDIGHGKFIDEAVVRIIWEGGPLPDAYFDEFALQFKLPKSAPGNVLYFPAVQDCTEGSRSWSEIPMHGGASSGGHAHHLHSPAPSLTLINSQ